jgi:hypothetical protein
MRQKIKNWLNLNKPRYATSMGWCDWQIKIKKEKPLQFWLQETFPDFIRDCRRKFTFPFRKTKEWVLHRTVYHSHWVRTGLKPGYHDCDEIMLHTSFSLLVDFVETELGWRTAYYDENFKHLKPSWFRYKFRLFFPTLRFPEAGVATLDDFIKCDIADAGIGYIESYKEIKELYLWWKNIRPNRVDPYELSGWNKVSDEKSKIAKSMGLSGVLATIGLKIDDDIENREDIALENSHLIDSFYKNEDQEMLIRLVRVRSYLYY